MEGTVFYWKQAEKDAIRGRDLKTGTVVRWKVPHISLALGVLRGTKKDFGFVVYR